MKNQIQVSRKKLKYLFLQLGINCFPAAFAINLNSKFKIYQFCIINWNFKNIYFSIGNIQMKNMIDVEFISTYLVTVLHNSLYIKWSMSAWDFKNCHLTSKF